jgi:hypothetical protein
MTLDFSTPGQVTITMIDYIKMICMDLPKDMIGSAATPAVNHLFQIDDKNAAPLDKDRANLFVHLTMQLLFLSQRGRPDIRTAVSFLCGHIQQPNDHDYRKLSRVMKYLQSTIDLPLVLSADGSGTPRWHIDASYAMHMDMRSHTGGAMTLGKGSVYSTLVKQKLVTRSSTEAEVVAVHDVMPQMLWTAYFLRAQGIHVPDLILFQDNMSAILLENNGRASASKRSRHMNIRYFFIADRVKAGDLRIEHCPTKDMIGDFFTKPLQGVQFYKLRDDIMNVDPRSAYPSAHRSVLSPKTRHNDDGTRDNDDDVTSTDIPTKDNASKRKSYLEALLQ